MQCAIFCNIIDNFGDIGVCWRLARQLAAEYQLHVHLYVDDLNSFAILAPEIQPDLAVQQLGQISVYHWHDALNFNQPFDVVIEGFGCRLSDRFIAQMQQQARTGQSPVWINLEYMSAEQWVTECHGMVSIHPATGLEQIFWFPSTTTKSGGLIREQALLDQRNQFQQSTEQQTAFWQSLGLVDAMQFKRRISLFSYENTSIDSLLTALAHDAESTLLLVPKSKSIPDIEHWLNKAGLGQTLEAGDQIHFQHLKIAVLPFLSHMQYDHLLWACELNFIRGEDSCVRAQWAAKPFIWHIYPQDDDAHLVKLQAWIDQVEQQSTSVCAKPLVSWQLAMQSWNGKSFSNPELWQQWLTDVPQWNDQLADWSNKLAKQPDLATRLMTWMQGKNSVSNKQ